MSSDAAIPAGCEIARYGDLTGWPEDDHAAAFAAFFRSAEAMVAQPSADGAMGVAGASLAKIAAAALECPAAPMDKARARQFFETYFTPARINDPSAFLTGYYEPEVAGSRVPDGQFRFPLYRRPDDLVNVDPAVMSDSWDPGMIFGRRTEGGIVPYHDRPAIIDGALAGRGLELVFLADPIDVFFIHVQGSATIRLLDGTRLRVAYAAKSGHPYTSIGKKLIERGVATAETMTLEYLRHWLAENRADGEALMRENRSYVFFQVLDQVAMDPDLGAIAAAGVQIAPGRSLAVDRRLHAYGTPIWLEAQLPTGTDGAIEPFRRLVIAQDTGSAIVGAARGDIFFGTGSAAGEIAGRIRHQPEAFVMLIPRDLVS
jgi:membrane-bound lytic murein transglycosylase A